MSRFPAVLLCGISAFAGLSAQAEEFLWSKDYLPIVRWAATYEPRAAHNEIDGFCALQFDVSVRGDVENERVLKCIPDAYFEDHSLEAVLRFEYQSSEYRIVDVIELFWFSAEINSEYSHMKRLAVGNRVMCSEASRECRARLAARQ